MKPAQVKQTVRHDTGSILHRKNAGAAIFAVVVTAFLVADNEGGFSQSDR
jgi:hypothetical protein